MKTKKTQNKQWFTLIELLVVITIIGILATVWVANFSGALSWARDSTRISNIKLLQTSLISYQGDRWEYPNVATGTISRGEFENKIKPYIGSSYPKDSKTDQKACRKMDVKGENAPEGGTGGTASADGWLGCGARYWVWESDTWMTNGWYKLGTSFEKEANVFWNDAQTRNDGGKHNGLFELHDGNVGLTADLTGALKVQ